MPISYVIYHVYGIDYDDDLATATMVYGHCKNLWGKRRALSYPEELESDDGDGMTWRFAVHDRTTAKDLAYCLNSQYYYNMFQTNAWVE